MFKKTARWVIQFSGWISLIGTLLSVWAGFYSIQLFGNLRTDIEELLPTYARSVIDLNEVTGRLESVDSISVILFSENSDAIKRLSIDLAKKLESLPDRSVAYVEYRIDRELAFFNARKGLYIDLGDLKNIRDYLFDRIQYEKALYNPLNIFSEEELTPPAIDIQTLQKKYESKVSDYSRFPEGFYATPNGKMRLLEVFMPGKVTGVGGAQKLRHTIDQAIAELNPDSYAGDIRIKFSGGVQNLIEEHHSLVEDLVWATLLTALLCALGMWYYYKTFFGTLALILSLFAGTLWTFGISFFAVGYLNANSAFMGSIVIGNGINFGIILLARYIEERRKNKGHERAIFLAMTKTFGATAVAAAAAGLAYGSLVLTSFRGFSQFGVIGLIGMALCWIAAYLMLPAYLTFLNRLGCLKISLKDPKPILSHHVAKVIHNHPSKIIFISILITVFSVLMLSRISDRTLETNLENLRDKKSMTEGSGYNSKFTNEILQRYGTPLVFLPSSLEESRAIADQLRDLKKKKPEESKIAVITHVDDFVPRNQEAKIIILNEIRRLLTPKIRSRMSPEDQKRVDEFLTEDSLKPVTYQNLPPLIQKKLREKDGSMGKLVLIEPPVKGLPNGNDLISFIAMLRKIGDSVREGVPIAGQLAVSADMIHAIRVDGPKATLFAFFSVIVLVTILFRRLRTIGAILIALLLGVLWMIGLLLAAEWKINFLNFIALPITFGIGVDYAVNIFSRWTLEGRTRISRVLGSTGGAVGLASYTTIIGYGSLLIASNQAFVSFGKLAVLGEFTCLGAAIFTLPAILRLREIQREKRMAQIEARYRATV